MRTSADYSSPHLLINHFPDILLSAKSYHLCRASLDKTHLAESVRDHLLKRPVGPMAFKPVWNMLVDGFGHHDKKRPEGVSGNRHGIRCIRDERGPRTSSNQTLKRLSRFQWTLRPISTRLQIRSVPRGALLLYALAIALAAGCGGGPPPLSLPPHAMVLRLADADDVPTLDPAAGYDTVSWTFEQAIFDTLVRYGDGNIELEPDIATAWESSPDATTFTFHLRADARFSDGRSVTSEDFRYGIERVLNPATRSKGMEYYRGIAGAADFAANRKPHVRGIDTPDNSTIVFHLSAPDPIFAHKLAMPFASAIPRDVAERWGDDFSRHVVGSGAFMLRDWTGGQRLVLVKNPYYFAKPLPHLDAIVESVGVSQELQWLRFDAGQIDAVVDIPPAEFPYVMKTPQLRKLTLAKTTVTTRYLGMNCQMWPFTDVRVRRALSYAIDRHKLIAILNGRGIVARGVMPPNLPGYDPDLKGYDYDPVKARALLEEAHLGDGFEFEIWMRADQTILMLAQSIQQDLAPL